MNNMGFNLSKERNMLINRYLTLEGNDENRAITI